MFVCLFVCYTHIYVPSGRYSVDGERNGISLHLFRTQVLASQAFACNLFGAPAELTHTWNSHLAGEGKSTIGEF